MKRYFISTVLFLLVGCFPGSNTDVNMNWAYHDDDDGIDNRPTEKVPGTGWTFLENGTNVIHDNDLVGLYVLTSNEFAGPRKEIVEVRWWNGTNEYWIKASIVTNIILGNRSAGNTVGTFHARPQSGTVLVNVWKAVVRPEMTIPGTNFYVIRLVAVGLNKEPVDYFLMQTDPSHDTDLGQAWTPTWNFYGNDWSLVIAK